MNFSLKRARGLSLVGVVGSDIEMEVRHLYLGVSELKDRFNDGAVDEDAEEDIVFQ